jgi:hypothetical protein
MLCGDSHVVSEEVTKSTDFVVGKEQYYDRKEMLRASVVQHKAGHTKNSDACNNFHVNILLMINTQKTTLIQCMHISKELNVDKKTSYSTTSINLVSKLRACS